MKKGERALRHLELLLEEIRRMDVTCDEVKSYGQSFAGFSSVSYSKNEGFDGPQLHNTMETGEYGPPHINIECGGFLLILDEESAATFVGYVRGLRNRKGKAPRK